MKRKPNAIGGQFAALPIEMLKSPAFRALSLTALRVLLRIEIEHACHGGKDNGNLPVTHDQFIEYGARKNSVAPALQELIVAGVIEITEKGRGGNSVWRRPNRFRLTYRSAGTKPATNEWRNRQASVEAHKHNNFRPPRKTGVQPPTKRG
jgi:hypothetical protein